MTSHKPFLDGKQLFSDLSNKHFMIVPRMKLKRVDKGFFEKHIEKYLFVPWLLLNKQACDSRFKNSPRKFIKLHSVDILAVLTTRWYSKILEDLIENKIIERTEFYIVGEQSYGYRLTEKYLAAREWTVLINPRLKPLKKESNLEKDPTLATLSDHLRRVSIDQHALDFLYYCFCTINSSSLNFNRDKNGNYTITTSKGNKRSNIVISTPLVSSPDLLSFYENSERGARSSHLILSGIAQLKYNGLRLKLRKIVRGRQVYKMNQFMYDLIVLAKIDSINNGYVKRDRTSYRVHTLITSLRSVLKNFLVVDEGWEPIASVDLANSQPFLVNLYLKKSGVNMSLPDVMKYTDLTSRGKFYEFLRECTQAEDREDIKKQFFSGYFFSENSKNSPKIQQFMRQQFPTIHDFVIEKKSLDFRQFAIELQRTESFFFIDRILPKILENSPTGSFITTLHDSIITNYSNVGLVREAILNEFRIDGFSPTLKTDTYNQLSSGDVIRLAS